MPCGWTPSRSTRSSAGWPESTASATTSRSPWASAAPLGRCRPTPPSRCCAPRKRPWSMRLSTRPARAWPSTWTTVRTVSGSPSSTTWPRAATWPTATPAGTPGPPGRAAPPAGAGGPARRGRGPRRRARRARRAGQHHRRVRADRHAGAAAAAERHLGGGPAGRPVGRDRRAPARSPWPPPRWPPSRCPPAGWDTMTGPVRAVAADGSAPLRIVVADDQASVREGLVLLLGGLPGIDVVGAAADGQQALELVAEHRPDAILLDLHMPVLDGIGATRRLTAEHPDVAIVVLTTYV